MKDFLYRTISEEAVVIEENGNSLNLKASRTRNSNGQSSISIQFGTQKIDFQVPQNYEQHARQMATLLNAVCDNPCDLPPIP